LIKKLDTYQGKIYPAFCKNRIRLQKPLSGIQAWAGERHFMNATNVVTRSLWMVLLVVPLGIGSISAQTTTGAITLEAIQFSAGPNVAVGNTITTVASDGSCCGLCLSGAGSYPLGTNNIGYATCFVGNSVYGGRTGVEDLPDGVAAAVEIQAGQTANVCGNTLSNGGLGFRFSDANSNALILNNNFAGATFGGIGYGSAGDSLNTAQIYGNILS
jgi:hypothetical protein